MRIQLETAVGIESENDRPETFRDLVENLTTAYETQLKGRGPRQKEVITSQYIAASKEIISAAAAVQGIDPNKYLTQPSKGL